MEQSKRKRPLLRILITTFVLLGTIFGADILLAQTSIYKLDKLAYELNDYNKHDYYKGYKPSLVRVTKKNFTDDLVMNSYDQIQRYFESNKYVENVYQVVSTPTTTCGYDISLLSQTTFSISEEKDDYGGYTLDRDEYTSYFGYDVLRREDMITGRFDCSGFIFITDKFADKLLEKYNIDSYQELITNKNYAVLEIKNKNTNTSVIKLSINNIIYSDKILAPLTKHMYGDFGVSYLGWRKEKQPNVKLSLDFQFKVDPYGSAKVLRELDSLGYTSEFCFYEIKIYNYSEETYILDTEFSNKLIYALNSENDILFLILGTVVFLFITCFLILTIDKFLTFHEEKIVEIVFIILFVIYGIIATFINIPWILSMVPVVMLLTYLFAISGILPRILKKHERKESASETNK